jgi:hypothetical protein
LQFSDTKLAPGNGMRGGFMHRCSSAFVLGMVVTLAAALTGCLGSSSPSPVNGGVKSVSISPTGTLSITVGTTQLFSATAQDVNGRTIPGVNIQFIVASGVTGSPAPLSISSAGNACAGNWDATSAICSAGNPGVAIVTAVANGVSSPQTTVYVHEHIDSLQASQAEPTPPNYDCFSQGQTWLYQAKAYSNGTEITSTVGPMTWASTNSGVLTATPFKPGNQSDVLNQVQITADSPGITQLYATVGGTTSNSLPITTCLVRSVGLEVNGGTASQISVNAGAAVTLRATAVDTLGNTIAKPPLTWSTTNPEVILFSTLTNATGTNNATARANLGSGDIFASCSPPSCNIGISGAQNPQGQILPAMPVYAGDGPLSPLNPIAGYGTIAVTVTSNSAPPTYSAWAATNQCGDVQGCTSVMFSITPGVNPIGKTVTLPRTPNSFMTNYQGSTRIYIGTNLGLMYVDVGGSSPTATLVSASSTPCNVSLCGTVLAISNDGKQVIVSDNISQTPQVYLYNAENTNATSTDLVVSSVVTAAAFSQDQSKIFLLTDDGTMYIYSTVNALASVPITTSGNTVAFSADGSFAYVAGASGGAGSVSAFSTCSTPTNPSTQLATVALAGTPVQIFPTPIVQHVTQGGVELISQTVYVLEASANQPTSIQTFTAEYTQVPIATTQPNQPIQMTCNPPLLSSLTAGPTYNIGQGAFTPLYARLVGNTSEIVLVGQKNPAVLLFNTINGTTTAVPLVNSASPLGASSSSDGSQVYIAACDQYEPDGVTCASGTVHIVNTVTQGDYQQVPYINYTTDNMCNGQGVSAPLCTPDIVAIKPQ